VVYYREVAAIFPKQNGSQIKKSGKTKKGVVFRNQTEIFLFSSHDI